MATANQLREQANLLLDEAFRLTLRSRTASNQGNVALAQQLLAESKEKSAQANALLAQADQTENSSGIASSGQVVTQEAQARSNNAVVQNTQEDFVPSSTGLNVPREEIEFGTDGRIRTIEETQSTPPAPLQPFASSGTEDQVQAPFASQSGGAGAPREDNPGPSANRTSQIINARFNQRIVPQSNVLDEYASYTYSLSWYLLTPDQYNEMIRSQKKNCAGWQLLIQSGGAPTQTASGGANGAAPIGGRNPFFSKDYYLDNLEIESRIPLKGTGAADGRVSIKFQVQEPNGITLIENLYRAVSDLYKKNNITNTANYPMAHYCMVIRFYGYNENGDLVTTGRRGTNGKVNLTDPRAIVEKFYPFVLTDINFKIPKDRIVEYSVEGKPIPHFYNKSEDRGTIPFSFELTGETLAQVLSGRPISTTNPPSPGERVDSPQPNTSAPTQPSTNNVDITATDGI